MGVHTVHVRRTVPASRQVVWDLLAEVTGWSTWGPFDASELESPGDDQLQGVGAVRRFRRGRWVTRERVLAFEPPHRLVYTVLDGIPVRDYVAEVTVLETPTGAAVTWYTTFRPQLPGTGGAFRRGLARFVQQVLDGLTDEAVRRAAAPEATATGRRPA